MIGLNLKMVHSQIQIVIMSKSDFINMITNPTCLTNSTFLSIVVSNRINIKTKFIL